MGKVRFSLLLVSKVDSVIVEINPKELTQEQLSQVRKEVIDTIHEIEKRG